MSLTYNDYLTTDYWKEVSRRIKARAGWKCQVCNSPHGLEAHHRTYEHRGNEIEHLEDLICLCRKCHSSFHGKADPGDSAQAYVPQGMFKAKNRARESITVLTGRQWLRAGISASVDRAMSGPMVLLTRENCGRLRSHKPAWHWMFSKGINPRKGGWRKRAVGHMVPACWMRAE